MKNTYVKITVSTLLALFFGNNTAFADNYCDGYEEGFKVGYHEAIHTPLDPKVPICTLKPIHGLEQPEKDYREGYDKGHKEGYAKGKEQE